MESDRPRIVIENLSHAFGTGESREVVLHDANLTIDPGEVVVLTGPSGSGKTTLLTLIGALRSIQEGRVQVLGHQLKGLRPHQQVEIRKNIGFIFQTHNLFDSLTGFQNVLLATQLMSYASGEAETRCRAVLESLGLGPHMHKKPHILSEGQRQRVAIARALVNGPSIVMADEPTAALDEMMARQVLETLRSMAGEADTTVLIVTHDDRVVRMADRRITMVDGRVESVS